MGRRLTCQTNVGCAEECTQPETYALGADSKESNHMKQVGVRVTAVLVFAGGFFVGHTTGLDRGAAEIAGTQVPISLSCEEDEVIWFTADSGTDALGCVHFETVAEYADR